MDYEVNTMKEIEAQIKAGNFKPVYLLYGEERYLVKHYEKYLSNAVIAGGELYMNLDILEGKEFSTAKAVDIATTAPFFADKRTLILRDTGLFESGKKSESEAMNEFLKNVPESTVIIFVESKVDKRSSLYKNVSKLGAAYEFIELKENELSEWASRHFKSYGAAIDIKDIYYLIRRVGCDMGSLASEIQKLTLYKGEGNVVTASDIDNICKKSLELNIFELVDAAATKNAGLALNIFNNLLLMKESPIMIIAMIARQFRLILQCKTLNDKGLNSPEIAQKTGLRSFMIADCMRQSYNFSNEKLQGVIKSCLETDLNIKTGKMADVLAVEMLILKVCS